MDSRKAIRSTETDNDPSGDVLDEVHTDLREVMRHGHGTVLVKVHDGRVAEVEKTLKRRYK